MFTQSFYLAYISDRKIYGIYLIHTWKWLPKKDMKRQSIYLVLIDIIFKRKDKRQ